MGPNAAKGEVRQLYVGTGVWKTSRLLSDDVQSGEDKDRIGCLISEVVVPGFEWVDHQWMRASDLDALYSGSNSDEMRDELQRLLRPERVD
jgi:uncharacterized protein